MRLYNCPCHKKSKSRTIGFHFLGCPAAVKFSIQLFGISAANANDLDSHVLEITDNTGTVAVIVCAVPFIRPKDLLTSEAGQDEKTKKQSLLTQIGDFYRALFERAQSLQQKHTHYVPIIGTGHLTSLGASISESVREIYVGTLESVPVELFPAFDYLALGHIHRAQTVAGLDHIRYSGSPIPLSFDELAREKTLVLLDTSVRTEGNKLIPELLSIPRFQRLLSVSGTLPEVLADIAAEVTVADQQAGADSLAPLWLEVRITADDYLSDLHKSLQEAMADKPIELLRVIRQAKTATAIQPPQTQTTLAELTVTEVFERCLDAAVGQEEDMIKQALLVAFNESLVAVQSALQGDETL